MAILSKGEILNDTYEIKRFIGEGGTGEVYLAHNAPARRDVAIKVLKEAFARDEKFLNLMRRELLQDVSDDAVLRYYDLLYTSKKGGLHFLVMEFIDGPLLSDLMKTAPVDTESLIEIGRRCAQGLRSAHAAKIFHRDISPDNIILRGGHPNRATLIDFGIAKDVRPEAMTVVDGFAGKFEYAAPEQLEAKTDARSDIYSLGATLLAAARGKVPELPVAFSQILAAKHSPLDTSDVPEPLASIIVKMTAVRPEDRIQTAAEVARVFDGTSIHSDGLDKTVRLQPAPKGIGRGSHPDRARRGRWAWVAVMLAVLAGAGVFVAQGGIQDLFEPSLPVAEPYRLRAEFGQPATVTGDAPTEEARAALLSAITDVAGSPPTAAIRLAEGVPSATWTEGVAQVIRAAKPLEQLRIEVLNDRIIVKGLATSRSQKDGVERAAGTAAEATGLDLDTNIRVQIQPLGFDTLSQVLEPYRLCGALEPVGALDPIPAEGDVRVEGFLTNRDDLRAMENELEDLIEGRRLTVGVQILNPFVCRVHNLLEPKATDDFRFTYAFTGGGFNNTNRFAPTDVPVIDLVLPESAEGHLYVFIADNEGAVIHMLPYLERQDNLLSQMGEVAAGKRTIRISHEGELDMSEGEPGTSFVFAVLTQTPLFDALRVRVENVEELAPDLAEALARAEQRGQLRGVAMRPIVVETP